MVIGIFKQLPSHKDFLIPSVVIFLCTIGHIILLQTKSDHCVESDMRFYLRCHLLLDMLIDLPQVFTYFIYIHPSEIYRPKSYDTCTYKILCRIKSIFVVVDNGAYGLQKQNCTDIPEVNLCLDHFLVTE